MAEQVLMPKAGITVEECIITEWFKKKGDHVKAGDILFTYETDKASFECESTAEGEILEIFYHEGDEVPVLVPVCVVGMAGEDISEMIQESAISSEEVVAPEKIVISSDSVAENVLMPKAGITVEECIITEWFKKKGDHVKVGDILFTYETDKASFECESTAEGEILEIFYHEGEEVPVLVPVCAVGNPNDTIIGMPDASAPEEVETSNIKTEDIKTTESPTIAESRPADGEVKISPRAKMLAKTLNIDPSLAAPSGPYGRIIEQDVRAYAESGLGTGFGGKVIEGESIETVKEEVSAPLAASKPVVEDIEYKDVEFSGIRKAISKTMMKSLSTTAQFTLQNAFDASQIIELRKNLKENAGQLDLPNITFNDMILFAVSRIVVNYPNLNANMIGDTTIRTFNQAHLGVAVDTPRGLMVPTIFNASKKSLAQIATEVKELASKCQEGSISPDALSGATFTISNLGAFGIETFTPVINPPQTGILGVGGLTTRVKEVDGEIRLYQAMILSLTVDHRAFDGASGAQFLKELANALENFNLLLTK